MRLLARLLFSPFLALAYLWSWVPFFVKNKLAWFCALLWFYVFRFRLNVILHNLFVIIPKEDIESIVEFRERLHRLAFKNLHHMVLLLFEIIERPAWGPRMIERKIEFVNLERILKYHDKKEGFFLMSGHLGNWEISTLAGCHLGLRLAIITRFLRSPFWDELWIQSRRRFGLTLLEESGSGLKTHRAIRNGMAVGFIMDQHTGRPHGIEASFLSQRAWCPKGLAILAAKRNVPIVPVYIVRQSDGHSLLYVEEALEFTDLKIGKSKLSDDLIVKHVERCNQNMEKWILRFPEQYLWMHKRFKGIIDYKKPIKWSSIA